MMLKVLKWIYGLGYRRGYADAVAVGKLKFYNPKAAQDDAEFMAEIDKVMQTEES